MKNVVIVVWVVIICLVGVSTGLAADVVKIGYLPLVMSLPVFVAVEEGFFDDQGLSVELVRFQSGTTIVDALVSGRIDATCTSAITTLWFAEQNVQGRFKIFLVYGTDSLEDNTFVVVVPKDSPLKSLKDLEGKKTGHFPGVTSLVLARAVMSTQLDLDEVYFTEVAPSNVVPALKAGQIDAIFTPEPFGMIAVSQGVGRYLRKSPVTLLGLNRGVMGGASSFSSVFIDRSPQHARKLTDAIEGAVDFIGENERKAREHLAKYTQLPLPVAMEIPFEKWIKIEDLDTQAPQIYFDLLYREGAYKQWLDTTSLYYE